MSNTDTLKTKRTLEHEGVLYEYFSLPEAARRGGDVSHLPFSLKVVLENLLRHEDGGQTVAVRDIEALSAWLERGCSSHESRQVRRLPRRGTVAAFPARPGHHRQHGAGNEVLYHRQAERACNGPEGSGKSQQIRG